MDTNWRKIENNVDYVYRLVISISAGVLCFAGAFFAIPFTAPRFRIDIIWSLLFPLLIALAWGKKWGLVSLLAGMGGFYPFFIWPFTGWGATASTLTVFLLILTHGVGAERRSAGKNPLLCNVYILQLIYSVFYIAVMSMILPGLLQANARFWGKGSVQALDRHSLLLIILKGLANFFVLVAIADILLFIPIVRKIFRLRTSDSYHRSSVIALSFFLAGWVSTIIVMTVTYNLVEGQKSFRWLYQPDGRVLMNMIVGTLLGSIGGSSLAANVWHRFETEELLKKSEEKYRTIFQNINDLYTEVDMDGNILTISPSVKRILGYDTEQLLGSRIEDLYCSNCRRTDMVQTILDRKVLSNYEVEVEDVSGNRHYLWLNAKLEIQANGEYKIISMARDVTQYMEVKRKQLESEENYRLIYEKMLNGFIIYEPVYNERMELEDMRYVDVNPGFEQLYRLKASEVVGKTWRELHHRPSSNMDTYKAVLETGQPGKSESYNPERDMYFFGNAFKMRDNQVGVIFENITSQKRVEAELHKLNEELEQYVLDRTADLQSAMREMEAFTYTVSHDLKAPLRAMDGYHRIILEEYGAAVNPEVEELILTVRNIGSDMIAMIGKLLEYATTARLEINREQVRLDDMFRLVFEELKPADRSIEFEFETGMPPVSADRILLKQVIYNIMSNAIKFTKTRERAFIVAGCRAGTGEYVFYVRDNGVGFDMDLSSKLFGIFQRLHPPGEFEGSGIGLAMIRKIIRKHGGKTWIEGKIEEGATLYFSLPNKKETG